MCSMSRAKDIAGQRFGMLVAVKRLPNKLPYKQAYWLFKCDCGDDYRQWGYIVWSGRTKSCGCLRSAQVAAGLHTKHGMTKAPEYRSWTSMKARCLTTTNAAYYQYGGNGIALHRQWVESFEAFFADMGKKPSPKHSLDRINNKRGYFPDNCRWATKTQQVRNRNLTIYVVHLGRKKPLAAWCDELALPYGTVHHRYQTGCRGERLFRPIGRPK